jgi:hypothetical protein
MGKQEREQIQEVIQLTNQSIKQVSKKSTDVNGGICECMSTQA